MSFRPPLWSNFLSEWDQLQNGVQNGPKHGKIHADIWESHLSWCTSVAVLPVWERRWEERDWGRPQQPWSSTAPLWHGEQVGNLRRPVPWPGGVKSGGQEPREGARTFSLSQQFITWSRLSVSLSSEHVVLGTRLHPYSEILWYINIIYPVIHALI